MIDIALLKVRAKTPEYKGGQWIVGTELDAARTSEGDNYTFLNSNYVENATICRFTGLKDANGTDIYENDRLKPAYSVDTLTITDEELKELEKDGCFSNPVVRWNPERARFQVISEYIYQTPPKMIGDERYIQSDYTVDHVRRVRFQALTSTVASLYTVYGNTIDNPDDSNYRSLPPKDADDFSDFYEEQAQYNNASHDETLEGDEGSPF